MQQDNPASSMPQLLVISNQPLLFQGHSHSPESPNANNEYILWKKIQQTSRTKYLRSKMKYASASNKKCEHFYMNILLEYMVVRVILG